jgi:hypothetical protein
LIPGIQQQHHPMHLKRQSIHERIDFTGMFLPMPVGNFVSTLCSR